MIIKHQKTLEKQKKNQRITKTLETTKKEQKKEWKNKKQSRNRKNLGKKMENKKTFFGDSWVDPLSPKTFRLCFLGFSKVFCLFLCFQGFLFFVQSTGSTGFAGTNCHTLLAGPQAIYISGAILLHRCSVYRIRKEQSSYCALRTASYFSFVEGYRILTPWCILSRGMLCTSQDLAS